MKKFREFTFEAKSPKIPAASRKKVVKELVVISKKKWKTLIDNGIRSMVDPNLKYPQLLSPVVAQDQ